MIKNDFNKIHDFYFSYTDWNEQKKLADKYQCSFYERYFKGRKYTECVLKNERPHSNSRDMKFIGSGKLSKVEIKTIPHE